MPLITLQSAKGYGFGGATAAVSLPNDFEAIASYTVSGSATSDITFSSIPADYKHLQIRGLVRLNNSGSTQNGSMFRFNGDTGSNYNWNQVYTANGGTVAVEAYVNETALRLGELPASQAPTSVFGFVLLDIYDYTNTNKYTTYHEVGGSDRNGASQIGNNWGVWKNTAAVNSVRLFETNGSWIVGSMLALYGIKG